MAIYNVDFNDVWLKLTPRKLRRDKILAYGDVLEKPLQYLRNLIFDDYKLGSVYDDYSALSAYTAGDRVIYTNRGVYEAKESVSGVTPTTATGWTKVIDNYIGLDERVLYNSRKILFEHALNRNFQCTGIIISNSATTASGFIVGETPAYSSTISKSSVPSAAAYIGQSFGGINNISYTIYVPTLVFTGLSSSNDTERVNIVRDFANKYNLAGRVYSVSGY